MAIDPTEVQKMLPKAIPAANVDRAVADAIVFLDAYGVDPSDTRYDLAGRLYVCHLLYMWGFAALLLSQSVGDMAVTRKDIELGDKEGNSPYLHLFRNLLRTSDFVVSI